LNNKNNTNLVANSVINGVGPGHLNSIKRVTQFLNLNLNTCFRSNYYNSNPCDFLYNIPTEVKNVVSMRLASITLNTTLTDIEKQLVDLTSKNNFTI
jgi:hypothetical protein